MPRRSDLVDWARHIVVILDAGETRVRFHDPGLPARLNRTERRDLFEQLGHFHIGR